MKTLLLALSLAVMTVGQAEVLPSWVPPLAGAWGEQSWVPASAGTSLAVAEAGVTFSGTVSGNDQGFLKGARVSIDGPVKKETTTDADGRFSIVGVEAGKYQVQVMAEGYLPVNQPMQVGTASVSVDILLLKLAGL